MREWNDPDLNHPLLVVSNLEGNPFRFIPTHFCAEHQQVSRRGFHEKAGDGWDGWFEGKPRKMTRLLMRMAWKTMLLKPNLHFWDRWRVGVLATNGLFGNQKPGIILENIFFCPLFIFTPLGRNAGRIDLHADVKQHGDQPAQSLL